MTVHSGGVRAGWAVRFLVMFDVSCEGEGRAGLLEISMLAKQNKGCIVSSTLVFV